MPNTYIFVHKGVYPVGACTVVVAEGLEEARALCRKMIREQIHVIDESPQLAWTNGMDSRIILDGDY